MGKIFIGGSRKWNVDPEKIVCSIIEEAIENKDDMYVGDCPEGIDRLVIETFIDILMHEVIDNNRCIYNTLYIVSNTECRLENLVDEKMPILEAEGFYTSVLFKNLKRSYESGSDSLISEVLQNNDILNPDWSDQSIKDKYMMELCDIHRFIWNGSSRATERNIIYSSVEDSLTYIPIELSNGRVIWEAGWYGLVLT